LKQNLLLEDSLDGGKVNIGKCEDRSKSQARYEFTPAIPFYEPG
jgi:hypothetical protein